MNIRGYMQLNESPTSRRRCLTKGSCWANFNKTTFPTLAATVMVVVVVALDLMMLHDGFTWFLS